MQKTILITGATDGIGLETAKMLLSKGHHVLLHGRTASKLADVEEKLSSLEGGGTVESFIADLSDLTAVETLAREVSAKHSKLDVLINNAGVLKIADPITPSGLDVRFVVNTLAPWVLTQRLLPLFDATGRVVNLSSAAQSTVDPDALTGQSRLDHMAAYSQSKLAITMWSRVLADRLKNGPAIIAVNPGSMLASKMVKEGFGAKGNDLSIGAEILTRAALDEAFADASGKYFDNDIGDFGPPHPDALDPQKSEDITRAIEKLSAEANL